jgi:signal transduction histidine kinase
MAQAGHFYGQDPSLGMYAFNANNIVHPFYQRLAGWNQVKFKLYGALGQHSSNAKDSLELAIQFFRNLILLAS